MNRTEMIERLEALRNKKTSADGSVTFDPFNEGDMALFRGLVQVLEALKAEEARSVYIPASLTLEDRLTTLEKQVERLSWQPTAVSVGEVVKKTVRTEMEALKKSGGAQ